MLFIIIKHLLQMNYHFSSHSSFTSGPLNDAPSNTGHLSHSRLRWLSLLLGAIAMGCFLPPSVIRAETTSITDAFGETGQRTFGGKLNGTMTDGGNASWVATTNLVLGGDSSRSFATVNNDELYLARVAVPTGAKKIRLEARVQVVPSGEKENFVAIGLGNPPSSNITWLGGIVLFMQSSGRAMLMIHPDNHDGQDPNKGGVEPVKSAACEGFNTTDMNKLSMVYDVEANTVSAWVNDTVIVEEFKLSSKGFAPVIPFAGFSGYVQQPDAPTVEDFRMTVE